MLKLTEKRFADFFRDKPETGMGYTIVTVHLKDGRVFPQTAVVGGTITLVRHHKGIPFTENDIDRFETTHDKWDWRSGGHVP
jgi:hypothetical protein